MKETIYRAKYALADSYTLIPDAAICVLDNGTISRITPWNHVAQKSSSPVMDWGSAVILPGFINSHIHLELTGLYNRLTRYDSFTDWLSQLIILRRRWDTLTLNSSINEGIALSLASGTTTVGDISSTGVVSSASRSSRLRKVIFKETIALSASQAEKNISDIERILDSSESGEFLYSGVSPHASYTVSAELYRELAKLASSRTIPLATHIAETEPEIEFLKTGRGEFRRFLQSMQALPEDWTPPGSDPIPYLHSLDVLGPLCLLIHCNYIDQKSIAMIAESESSVVYCPRSHAFFGHQKHPVRKLLDAGINVALGTDSLASNTSLSLLDEMRFLCRYRPDLKPEEILQMATINGAKALNFINNLGKLKPGYRADMTVLEMPSNTKESNILHHILEGAGECIGTIVGGKTAWRRKDRT